uniref:Uncharacterized protein n=1 Tax=Sphaerodactylus townsendi TaxID=933632 RepID=A0ACB8EG22_9SAUR
MERLSQGLLKAALCSICLEFFNDPVSIECGHNFCRACISRCCDASRGRFCCPHCRRRACKRDFRANRELAGMVEAAKRLRLQEEEEEEKGKTSGGKGQCEKHQEPLKLFCEDDQMLICVVCDRSKEHRSHTVTPLEEAALDYKEQLQSQLNILKQKKERLQDRKQASEQIVEEYLENLDTTQKKITSKFELLHQYLEEMEQLLLDELDQIEMEVQKGQKESNIRFSEEISILGDLISEMEETCKQSASEFLQSVKNVFSRSNKEELHLPVEISQDLKEKLSTFDKKNVSLENILKKFKGETVMVVVMDFLGLATVPQDVFLPSGNNFLPTPLPKVTSGEIKRTPREMGSEYNPCKHGLITERLIHCTSLTGTCISRVHLCALPVPVAEKTVFIYGIRRLGETLEMLVSLYKKWDV